MLVLVRLAVVVEWINDGDVALHGYQNQVKQTHVRDHLHQRCESRNDNVEAATRTKGLYQNIMMAVMTLANSMLARMKLVLVQSLPDRS